MTIWLPISFLLQLLLSLSLSLSLLHALDNGEGYKSMKSSNNFTAGNAVIGLLGFPSCHALSSFSSLIHLKMHDAIPAKRILHPVPFEKYHREQCRANAKIVHNSFLLSSVSNEKDWENDKNNKQRKIPEDSISKKNNTINDDNAWEKVQVAGVSVSPLGFLVLLRTFCGSSFPSPSSSSLLSTSLVGKKQDRNEVTEIVFPVQITSSSSNLFNLPISAPTMTSKTAPPANNSDVFNISNDSDNMSMPELFRENIDQTSVTTPEALTFLQLLNGVDMATPIFPPDTLSLICVWYAFLVEEKLLAKKEREHEVKECDAVVREFKSERVAEEVRKGDAGGGLEVEDELGLLSWNNQDFDVERNDSDDTTSDGYIDATHFTPALDYIRAMVRTTMPGSGSNAKGGNSYSNVFQWQRVRVKLPRVWFHGIRLQELDSSFFSPSLQSQLEQRPLDPSQQNGQSMIGVVPIQHILECSVDDGTKWLEIPLFAIPSLFQHAMLSPQHSSQQKLDQFQMDMDISNEILQELSHSFNSETSASFISLSLFHRYCKSTFASRNGSRRDVSSIPSLKVSKELLRLLKELEEKEEGTRYCWILPSITNKENYDADDADNDGNEVDNDVDVSIQNTDLPMYRPLCQLQESNRRVPQQLTQQNFVPSPTSDESNNSSNNGNKNSNIGNGSIMNSSNATPRRKRALTLEQRARQEKLKSAWKIAMQKGDSGALEKIRKAMEELEKELLIPDINDDYDYDGTIEETSLQKIRRAMRESGNDNGVIDKKIDRTNRFQDEGEEDVVGLIADLEEATKTRLEDNTEEEAD